MEKLSHEDTSFYNLFLPFTSKKALIYLAIVGSVVYFNMLFNGFVWDDVTFIINNPQVYEVNLAKLFGVNMFNDGGYFRPIPALYFALLYHFFGQWPFYYHAVQLMLHISVTFLVFWFFRKFFGVTLSFVLSLIFLVSPIQVESVSYIGATQSELLMLFGLGGVLIAMGEKLSAKALIAMSGMLLLSLLTKETSFLFVIIVPVVRVLLKKREALRVMLAVSLSVLCYFFMRLYLFHIPFRENLSTPISNLSLPERLINIPLVFFYYIRTFFYPGALGIDQRWIVTRTDILHFYLPLAADLLFLRCFSLLGRNAGDRGKRY